MFGRHPAVTDDCIALRAASCDAYLRALPYKRNNHLFCSLVGDASHLKSRLRLLPVEDRQRITDSQLHMSMNRLGLTNLDEFLLCSLLRRVAHAELITVIRSSVCSRRIGGETDVHVV